MGEAKDGTDSTYWNDAVRYEGGKFPALTIQPRFTTPKPTGMNFHVLSDPLNGGYKPLVKTYIPIH